MATAPVGIAPVFTTHTFERLLGWAEESRNRQLAESLRGQLPFVMALVEGYFRPLTSIRTAKDFRSRFDLYALRFEPYRIYLNARILEALAGQDVFLIYYRALNEVV